ncbi:MAG: GMC family oxidoreductase N-terminal domain-containing protein [Actinomycetota bacterium]
MNASSKTPRHIVVVGGGTAGSVVASRLSEHDDVQVTLLEAGPDHDAYDASVLEPAQASAAWAGAVPSARTPMALGGDRAIPMFQGRLLGGTSALNGMATLRGLPEDYDGWAASGLDGWAWDDVVSTFIAAERDVDFGSTSLHGDRGPLPVRRWRLDELSRAQRAFHDGMVEVGQPTVADINDPAQLPGIGVFPVTIDEHNRRVTTSLAYLGDDVRARPNLTVRTGAEVATVEVSSGRAIGVTLVSGEQVSADEVVVSSGAIWTPALLMRSGIGPAGHLAGHGITVHADLPVGETMSDHLGPGIPYRHDGPRGGEAGPAQVLVIGASNGSDVDYHAFPVASVPSEDETVFLMAAFLLRSSGRGAVRLGDRPGDDPVVTAPPLPDDGEARLRHAFDQIAAWERSSPAVALGCTPVEPHDLSADDAVAAALDRLTVSYGHMTSTCPMGTVLDADCRVLGVEGLRVVDASVMPTIPSGNTYLGCVMIAERVTQKMAAEIVG